MLSKIYRKGGFMNTIWVFNGEGGRFPSGVFSTKEKAQEWILINGLTGTLTGYPMDVGIYDWAISHDFFSPKKEREKSPEFIQRFSCAQQSHLHFENGKLE